MIAIYRVADPAQEDLHDIWVYIAGRNPDAAERQIESLYRKF